MKLKRNGQTLVGQTLVGKIPQQEATTTVSGI
jgi:hypothetical protein